MPVSQVKGFGNEGVSLFKGGDSDCRAAAIVVLGLLMTPLHMSALVTAYDELSLDVK